MRGRRALGGAILVGVMVSTAAVPALAAQRSRLFRGTTSQGETIKLLTAKTRSGDRFLSEMSVGVTSTCDDQTTIGGGFGYGFGRDTVPIVDGAFAFDDVSVFQATHLAGQFGGGHAGGTLSYVLPGLTADGQAQLCTTGDLTWEADYVRTITRQRIAPGTSDGHFRSDAGAVLRLGHP